MKIKNVPSFSRTLPDLVDAMNLYRTAMSRCIENNKIYDAITFLFGMNSQLDDSNRVIFSDRLFNTPRSDKDVVRCPECFAEFNPKPNIAVIVDSMQPLRKCQKCDAVFDYIEHVRLIKGIYNIYLPLPEIKGYANIRKHRGIMYAWFNGALQFIDGAYRNYRLNYKGANNGNE